MKKLIGVLLALMLLIGIVALAEPVASDSTATESAAAEIVETVEETAEEVIKKCAYCRFCNIKECKYG